MAETPKGTPKKESNKSKNPVVAESESPKKDFEIERAELARQVDAILGPVDGTPSVDQLNEARGVIKKYRINVYGYNLLRVQPGNFITVSREYNSRFRDSVSARTYLEWYMETMGTAIVRDLNLPVLPYDLIKIQSEINKNNLDIELEDEQSVSNANCLAYSLYVTTEVAKASEIPFKEYLTWVRTQFGQNVIDGVSKRDLNSYDDFTFEKYLDFFSNIQLNTKRERRYEHVETVEPEVSVLDKSSDVSKRAFFYEIMQSTIPATSEEVILFQEMQELELLRGDYISKGQEIVTRNMRMVIQYAKNYFGRSPFLEFSDHFQNGSIGLIWAVKKYRWEEGRRLSTYATNWIKVESIRPIHDDREIKLPQHVNELTNKVSARLSKFLPDLDFTTRTFKDAILMLRKSFESRYPLSSETQIDKLICEYFEVDGTYENLLETLDKVDRSSARNTLRLDMPLGTFSTTEALGNLIPDRTGEHEAEMLVNNGEMRRILYLAMGDSNLSDRDRRIVVASFGLDTGEGRTLQDVGNEFGLTRERVRQIVVASVNRLRKAIENYPDARELLE
jgi:RNA polymerase primary sigma factor